MVSFPPCKINLGLHVTRKRSDGYHDLVTCFYPVWWTDVLEVISSDDFSFEISGNSIPGSVESNLCVKAYDLLKNDLGIGPVKIHLHKVIPTGAGLGGGSSDGAHALRILNCVFNLKLSDDALMTYAARLGSDCSFFIQDSPMIGSGRGEILDPVNLSLKGKFLALLKPEIHVSTADAYAGIRPRLPDEKLIDTLRRPVHEWQGHLRNDFEDTVFAIHPLLPQIKEMLYANGALYAAMSGSGSTLFGIFDEAPLLNDLKSDMTIWGAWLR
ncbi:MAG: 4-(cytidine 5'-diphospho)-2-C-methyl-D-erythritol kinase [Chryseolinea sp.]